jgi:hypothetical protein
MKLGIDIRDLRIAKQVLKLIYPNFQMLLKIFLQLK